MSASSDSKTHELDSDQAALPQCSDSLPSPDHVPFTRRTLKIGVLLGVVSLLTIWNINYARDLWREGWTTQPSASPESGSANLAQLGSRSRSGRLPFDLSTTTIPANEIRSGGPPKDGIPALTRPQFVAAGDAGYLAQNDRVIGFVHGQEARAYPLRILNYHEIVNDQLGDVPVAITYCPLCDSAAALDRRTPLGVREFGVSGLLYNSNVLIYDRGGQPESLWSQIKAEGISGPGAEKSLKALPVELTSWGDWRARHLQTTVLSPQTGHPRDYRRNPYTDYFTRPDLMFSVRPTSDRLPTKERVLGVWDDTTARAYPVNAFSAERRRVADKIDGKKVVIEYNPRARSLRVVEADQGVEWMYSFWFAWHALRPETEVFK